MTLVEYYLVAIFAAVWLVPAFLAVRWEWRLRTTGMVAEAGRE